MAISFQKGLKKIFNPQSIKSVVFWVLLWRVLTFSIAAIGYFLLAERYAPLSSLSKFWQSNFMFWSWANFDSEHYLKIAQTGYGYSRGLPLFSFFPLYPLLLRFFSFLCLGDLFLAGQLIILILLPLTIYFANKILKNKGFDGRQILVVDLLFLFSPGGVFLNAFYTELPFLFFVILSFYFLDQKKYFGASLWAVLASGTRVVGIFLAPAIFWKLLKDKKVSWFKRLLFPFISTLGLLIYIGYLGIKFGDPLLFGLSHRAWGKAQIVFPLITLWKYVETIVTFPKSLSFLNYYVVVLEFLITVGVLFSFIVVWLRSLQKKNISSILIFSTLCFILPFLTGSLGTMPRYLLTFLSLFPYWAGKMIKVKNNIIKFSIYAVIFLVFVSGVILFTRGYWWG